MRHKILAQHIQVGDVINGYKVEGINISEPRPPVPTVTVSLQHGIVNAYHKDESVVVWREEPKPEEPQFIAWSTRGGTIGNLGAHLLTQEEARKRATEFSQKNPGLKTYIMKAYSLIVTEAPPPPEPVTTETKL